MVKHTPNVSGTRALRRDSPPMNQTNPTIVHEIIARVAEVRAMSAVPPDDVVRAVQLACARWLAGYRAALGISIGQVARQTGVEPQRLLWLDLGLAAEGMLTDEQETALRSLLFAGPDADRQTLESIYDLAMGRPRPPDPRMLEWLLEDLELNVWQQGDLETMFAEFFAPAEVDEIQQIRRLLRPVHEILLEILLLGAKSSHELRREALERLGKGKIGFDNAAYAAVLDLLVTQGLVELLPDRQDDNEQRNLRQLRLTTFGRRVIGLQRYVREAQPDKPDYLYQIARWMQSHSVFKRGVP